MNELPELTRSPTRPSASHKACQALCEEAGDA